MASRLNPYLAFPGTAREAMTFYASVLGGAPEIMTFGDSGAADAPDPKGVMHARLDTPGGFTLMASDMAGDDHVVGSNVSISISGEDDAELRGYWDKLAAECTVAVPLSKQSWGDEFGMCTDRFGITWMINITQSAG